MARVIEELSSVLYVDILSSVLSADILSSVLSVDILSSVLSVDICQELFFLMNLERSFSIPVPFRWISNNF